MPGAGPSARRGGHGRNPVRASMATRRRLVVFIVAALAAAAGCDDGDGDGVDAGRAPVMDGATEAGARDGSRDVVDTGGMDREASSEAGQADATPDLRGQEAGLACMPPSFPRISTRIETAAGTIGCVEGGWLGLPASDGGDAGASGDAAAPEDASQPLPLTWTGKITSVDVAGFTLDLCGTESNCAPLLVKFTIEARGLIIDLKVGVFVTVTAEFFNFYGCHHNLVVTNLATLGGVSNPVDDRAGLALVVTDGYLQPAQDLWKTTARREHCLGGSPIMDPKYEELPAAGLMFPLPDNYTLHFAPRSGTGAALDLRMEQTAVWAPGPATTQYRLHNLRSFQLDATDAYWDWAYWAQRLSK